ncbi:MAG: hypothetical protein LCH56_03485 [Proteobacteria bacterium]|nr:hypothetical protein [Pseudomonadota bacterium]
MIGAQVAGSMPTEQATLPAALAPASTIDFAGVAVPVARPAFPLSPFPNIWGHGTKPVVDHAGTACFAEIALVGLFEEAGWRAVWVDSWKSRYLRAMPGARTASVPEAEIRAIPALARHATGFTKFGGGWDVLAWKNDAVVFCDAKRIKKDSIKPNQIEWMHARLAEGARPENFLIAEWTPENAMSASVIRGDASFKLRTGRWYAWHMFPGYTDMPYSSPIRIDAIGPAYGSNRITLEFLNALYAAGVQNFRLDLDIITWSDRFIAAVYEERVVIISELTPAWLDNNCREIMRGLGDLRSTKEISDGLDRHFGLDAASS